MGRYWLNFSIRSQSSESRSPVCNSTSSKSLLNMRSIVRSNLRTQASEANFRRNR